MILTEQDRQLLRSNHPTWEREFYHWRWRARQAEKSAIWLGVGLLFASAALVGGIALWIANSCCN